jgi:outer membrane protein assembly factor BamB
MVLVPAWNGTLFALDAQTGTQKWNYPAGQPLRSKPVSDGTNIYLASGDGRLSVLNANGSFAWQVSVGSPLLRAPLMTPRGVVITSREGHVFALTPSGQKLWQRELGELCYYGDNLYHNGEIFIATAGNGLWKLNAESGEVIWRRELAGPTYATPLLDDGRLYIGDNSGSLQVFGSDSGDLLWSTQLDREIQGRPLVWNDQLLFGSRDHRVHAYRFSVNIEPSEQND